MAERASSVILLSGGLDSSANLALCHERDLPVLGLTVDYGQRAAAREIEAARKLCSYYGVRHEVVPLRWLGELGGSSLTENTRAVPVLQRAELDDPGVTTESAKSVWVPNRNGVLINVGAAWAERLAASRVVVGFNREEAATFPDNSVEFLNRATAALELSSANHARVFCYTADLDKRQIVGAVGALSKPFPFDLLWSCYHGGEAPCGGCESCQRLKRARGLA